MSEVEPHEILDAFTKAGYPLSVTERSDGKWEVTVQLGDSPTTLFANANTRDAAIEHASRTILPTVILAVMRTHWKEGWPKAKPRGLLEGESSLATVQRTNAQQFGGFGVILRFHEEPDGSYAWGVFDEKTGDGLSSGVEDVFEDAKIEALLKLLPPSGES